LVRLSTKVVSRNHEYKEKIQWQGKENKVVHGRIGGFSECSDKRWFEEQSSASSIRVVNLDIMSDGIQGLNNKFWFGGGV